MNQKEVIIKFKTENHLLNDLCLKNPELEIILLNMLTRMNEKACMSCEKEIEYSKGVFTCDECSY